MNTQEYISSGTLEMYVLGALSPEEAVAVEKAITQYPELREERVRIELALEDFAMGLEKFPRPNMKARVMAAITENKSETTVNTTKPEAAVRQLNTAPQHNTFKYAAAASIAILLASNVIFVNKWQSAEKQLSETIAQNYKLAENYKLTKNIEEKVLSDYNVATNHSFKVVELKGLAVAPTANAYVYWNSATQEAFIDVRSLPAPAADKQYQLWALVDGKPVDAGVFELASAVGGLQKVKNIQMAQAFAVTLEKKGGSPSPTLSAMYLMAQI